MKHPRETNPAACNQEAPQPFLKRLRDSGKADPSTTPVAVKQENEPGPAQGSSSAGAAAAEPYASQHLHAADDEAAAEQAITVGQLCSACNNIVARQALWAWAHTSYPTNLRGAALAKALSSKPAAHLLLCLDSYLHTLSQSERPDTAAQRVYTLRMWMNKHQAAFGGSSISHLLLQLTKAWASFMRQARALTAPGRVAPMTKSARAADEATSAPTSQGTAAPSAVTAAAAGISPGHAAAGAFGHKASAARAGNEAQEPSGSVEVVPKRIPKTKLDLPGKSPAAAHAAKPATEGATDEEGVNPLHDPQPLPKFSAPAAKQPQSPSSSRSVTRKRPSPAAGTAAAASDTAEAGSPCLPRTYQAAPPAQRMAQGHKMPVSRDLGLAAQPAPRAVKAATAAAATNTAINEALNKEMEVGAPVATSTLAAPQLCVGTVAAAEAEAAGAGAGAGTEAEEAYADAETDSEAGVTAPTTVAEAEASPCTFEQLRQLLQQQPNTTEALSGLDELWEAAKAQRGPTIKPAATQVRPFMLMFSHPEFLQSCWDSVETGSNSQCQENLPVLSGLQALLAQPAMQRVMGKQQQQQLLSDLTALVDACKGRLKSDAHITIDKTPAAAAAVAPALPAAPTESGPTAGNADFDDAAAAVAAVDDDGDDVFDEKGLDDLVGSLYAASDEEDSPDAAAAAAASTGDVGFPAGTAAVSTDDAASHGGNGTAATGSGPMEADAEPAAAGEAAAAAPPQPAAVSEQTAAARFVDVFQAQTTLLTMCAAEQLLSRGELIKLRRRLQRVQAVAVQLANNSKAGQQKPGLEARLGRFHAEYEWVLRMSQSLSSTVEDTKAQIAKMLGDGVSSMPVPTADAVQPSAVSLQAAASAVAMAAATAAPPTAAVPSIGRDSTWMAAENSVHETIGELTKQHGGQSTAQTRSCVIKILKGLQSKDHMDVHAKFFLAHMEWLHFCRSNLDGLMMPDDVQVALVEILSLAALT